MPNPFVYLTDLLRGCVMTGVDRPDRLVGDFYFAYITFGNSLQCDPKLPQRNCAETERYSALNSDKRLGSVHFPVSNYQRWTHGVS
jgi:hypothetical protein